jgi:hypothetical protein
MAVDAPIPSASVNTATTAKPRDFPKFLSAYRTSWPSVPIVPPAPKTVNQATLLFRYVCPGK